jgi:branched-chain amino acid transport system permease protein
MSPLLLLFQLLNGLQFGVMLFLLAAGMTLIFGIMNFVNLAHGSFYMMGAYIGAAIYNALGIFPVAIAGAVAATVFIGWFVERLVFVRLYRRDHLDQVLSTYGFILVFNEIARSVWGVSPYFMPLPDSLAGSIEVFGLALPGYRLVIVGAGFGLALASYVLIHRTRFGMLVRAGAQDAEMVSALGINITLLNTLVFGLGAGLAGFAGILAAPVVSVEPEMGEAILILTIVVIVVGGVGSVRGAFFAALIVGLIDTMGRVLIPPFLAEITTEHIADAAGPALASVMIYLLMAIVLGWRPDGLFPVRGR